VECELSGLALGDYCGGKDPDLGDGEEAAAGHGEEWLRRAPLVPVQV